METKIVKECDYKKIVNDLLNGEVVGFPTETVYGLAIVYNNKEAFDKLYEIKNRAITKPISMMVANKELISSVAYIDDRSSIVMDKYMPGALTLIFKAHEDLPKHVTFNYQTIGIRIPTNEIALKILKGINLPLLVTSANVSGEPSLMKYQDVYEIFKGKIASLISSDAINGVASTVALVSEKPIKVFREGPILKEDLERILGD